MLCGCGLMCTKKLERRTRRLRICPATSDARNARRSEEKMIGDTKGGCAAIRKDDGDGG
ncbi:hypothetical protein SLEP1_g29585 [Rubroshorea leprosula]|uniref:Uncharacterized protein n=1 Tax=Rubroshorea leprosula TaxID=152421 RepID=A0AAV5JZV3_9ROSI|nr:hypothetical protein SLEP1_g29585 [Rubroshorea leprosula]